MTALDVSPPLPAASNLRCRTPPPDGHGADAQPPSFSNYLCRKHARLWSTLNSHPFVCSFIEERHPGTLRRTRANTRLNKKVAPARDSCLCAGRARCHACSSPARRTSAAQKLLRRRRVHFQHTVEVFSHALQSQVVQRSIRFAPPRAPRGAERDARARRPDANAPQSLAGKWLLRRSSAS